ncbi:MAG: hypothetical protein K2I56_08765 [Muribaculaceae bacterium]|nr:hypothetical protein [Muribaculaceae bacterium]
MKVRNRLCVLLLALLAAVAAGEAAEYDAVAVKAGKYFGEGEWASAQALYELMLAERPDLLDTYAHAIVASAMRADTLRMTDLLERSAAHSVGIYPLFDRVRELSFEVGRASVYGDFLALSARDMPWLSRPVDAALLEYYRFRHDGPMIVEYAGRMLRLLPRSVEYLSALAYGYMLCGDFAGASDTWRYILEIAPDDYDTLLYLGNYYADCGDMAEASACLSRAYALRPTPYVGKWLKDNDASLSR